MTIEHLVIAAALALYLGLLAAFIWSELPIFPERKSASSSETKAPKIAKKNGRGR